MKLTQKNNAHYIRLCIAMLTVSKAFGFLGRLICGKSAYEGLNRTQIRKMYWLRYLA